MSQGNEQEISKFERRPRRRDTNSVFGNVNRPSHNVGGDEPSKQNLTLVMAVGFGVVCMQPLLFCVYRGILHMHPWECIYVADDNKNRTYPLTRRQNIITFHSQEFFDHF